MLNVSMYYNHLWFSYISYRFSQHVTLNGWESGINFKRHTYCDIFVELILKKYFVSILPFGLSMYPIKLWCYLIYMYICSHGSKSDSRLLTVNITVVKLTQITEFLWDKLIENAQFIPRAF